MQGFNRERFVFYLLAGVLGVQALFFGYGMIACSRVAEPHLVCPQLGERFDAFGERTLAAVLGLVAGSAAVTIAAKPKKKPEEGDPAKAKPPEPDMPPKPRR